ncbi:aminotransferase class III-fold pyridoxal phosphate-dependent enzyme [Streptomyces sp. NPDC047123]|uniref:aspartate aminotransferase family protein n=1 Tax=Streptomyces sp. NPDC047123 TaxID=3155622 RepID=UPI0033CB9837
MEISDLMDRHRAVLPPWVPLFYDEPLEIESGSGRMVRGADGRDYLDFYAGVAVNTLGYDVPEIREAVERKMRTGIVHSSTFYLVREQIDLAERIAAASGIDDPVVFFTTSGSDAVETALLLATQYRRSQQVIALRYAYHGRSFGALSVTGDRAWQAQGFTPLRVAYARSGDKRNGGLAGLDDAAYAEACAEDLREIIATGTPERTAAMLVEPVQGVAGAVPLVPGQLRAYADVLEQHDILLIADEVQTGWGRTGRYWGYQWHDVTPDLLVFAKGVGSGFPLGGVVGRREVMTSLPGASVSTFGGNPLACAAALATLDYVDAHDLPAHALTMGRLLRETLDTKLKDPGVGHVRGTGLLMAVEFVDPLSREPDVSRALRVQERCRHRGLLVGLGGAFKNCLRIMPPLTVTAAEVRQAAGIIAAAVDDVPGGEGAPALPTSSLN